MREREKLVTALRMFAAFANPEPAQAMRDAAAQIEADGKEIERLKAVEQAFLEMTDGVGL